jgi:zeta-carotene desaturase
VNGAVVLGGGVAGIAAAFRLRDQGHAVTLIEPRSQLGGRAFSRVDQESGLALDNGPHVILGVYREFRALLRRIGGETEFLRPAALRLDYAWPDGARARLRLPPLLPAPLALPFALLRLRGVPLRARIAAVRGMLALLLGARRDETVGGWLARRRQHGRPRELLWDPLCRAVFNAEADDVAAPLFARTLRRAFGGGAAAAAIWLPRVGWSELLDRRVRAGFARQGIELLRARVVALAQRAGRIEALGFADGSRLDAGDRLIVSALPWHALARLLPERVPAFAASPIVTVHCRGGAPLPLPPDARLVVLAGGAPFHYLYRRPGDPPDAFALLAGAARWSDGQPVAAIERTAREQLARWFPGAAVARAIVRKEAAATLQLAPADLHRRPRPGPVPGIANLRLCGDWTDTGLPATLEGAALSARLALRS